MNKIKMVMLAYRTFDSHEKGKNYQALVSLCPEDLAELDNNVLNELGIKKDQRNTNKFNQVRREVENQQATTVAFNFLNEQQFENLKQYCHVNLVKLDPNTATINYVVDLNISRPLSTFALMSAVNIMYTNQLKVGFLEQIDNNKQVIKLTPKNMEMAWDIVKNEQKIQKDLENLQKYFESLKEEEELQNSESFEHEEHEEEVLAESSIEQVEDVEDDSFLTEDSSSIIGQL